MNCPSPWGGQFLFVCSCFPFLVEPRPVEAQHPGDPLCCLMSYYLLPPSARGTIPAKGDNTMLTEKAVLARLYDNGGHMLGTDLLNSFPKQINQANAILHALCCQGLVQPSSINRLPDCSVSLTSTGEAYLFSLLQRDRTERTRFWISTGLSIVVLIATILFGVLSLLR